MAIIALKAWYLPEYEPFRELEKRPHDIRLSKNSLLKSALRADFLDDIETVKQSAWFQRYLEGETVEFYVEGSGGYAIANIDLSSHEIYFTKQDVLSALEPMIFFCYQNEYPDSSQILREVLTQILEQFNARSRFPLNLEESHRLTEGPIRLNSALLRKIRKSLLFIADTTAIVNLATASGASLATPSPAVCVEVGYALQSKRSEQILLVQMDRSDIPGSYPFDISSECRLNFRNARDLQKLLPDLLESRLARFSLFTV